MIYTDRNRSRQSFNSRPHKEVDILPPAEYSVFITFNSRPHKEVDTSLNRKCRAQILSIHDLTRRSTVHSFPRTTAGYLSIHDLTRRSTALCTFNVSIVFPFQFTTSQGGRRCIQEDWKTVFPFNSRPHKEVDHLTRFLC